MPKVWCFICQVPGNSSLKCAVVTRLSGFAVEPKWNSSGFKFKLAWPCLLAGLVVAFGAQALEFTAAEIRAIARHGPWPPAIAPDPSNRVSGHAPAIEFGERLFFDPRLSGDGRISCASCHQPDRGWTDGLPRSTGRSRGDRNTPALWNLRLNRWFGWDGGSDNLWAQSIRPMLDPAEMRSTVHQVARTIRRAPDLACGYKQAFAASPSIRKDEEVVVEVGKALAAFQERIVSERTPFDEFRDALVRGNERGMANYPEAAQRGLRIFVGKGRCNLCHVGPNFSNGEFHDVAVGYFVERGRVDPGRHAGLSRLAASPFTLTGKYTDDPDKQAVATRHVTREHRNWGEFRTPSLRNVALTAPYMHNGSLASLRDVVRHYSEIDEERLHADGEKILQPLRLDVTESDDLIEFLSSLSHAGVGHRARPTPKPECK